MKDSMGYSRLGREIPEPDYDLVFIEDERPRGRRLTPEELTSGWSPDEDD